MVLHAAGRYQESIAVLAEADKLAQQLEVVSISEEARALLSSERERAYRGEDFEKLMVTVLQALNYAELGKDEDALVEVRRVNERIHKMIVQENKPYERLAIARYLGGVLYEDQGEWDSAFIDYQDASKLRPDLGPLAEPLIRLAKKTRRDDAYRELRAKYPEIAEKPLGPDEGQIVVVVEAGLSPEKVPNQREYRPGKLVDVPVYRNRWYPAAASVQVGQDVQMAVTVTSIQQVARVHLEDRIGRMLAKSLASTAVKAGVAAGAAALTKEEKVGWLTFLLLSMTTNADLRSWLSLPAEFQVARFRARPGKYPVNVEQNGVTTQHQVEVQPRRIALTVVRRY
jgi:tetratricopeptide (TPR) repeat protein